MTLIELVSAMAIFMVIVGALLVGTNNAFETWRGASSRTRTLGRARAALNLITDDLLQATAATNDFVLTASDRPAWAFDSTAEALWSNAAEFDRIAAAPSALGAAPDGRVIWRLEATNHAALLVREISYATNDTPRVTEVLDGVTRLLFVAIAEDPDASFTEGTTNALPAAVDIFLELVPPDAFRKAAGIADPEKKQSFLASQTLPLTTRVTFPHSRVPPLAAATNVVYLSGRLADAAGQPVTTGVELIGGRTGTVKASADGAYRIAALQTGRPIRVTPQEPHAGRAGRYTPQWLTWHPGAGSRDNADFLWRESDITISGTITRKGTSEPVEGVVLIFQGADGDVTKTDGSYRIGIYSGWPYDGSTAHVSPSHPFYPDSTFEAVGTGAAGDAHRYQNVIADQTGRDYLWIPPDLILTGAVTCAACGTPLNGIRLRAEGDGILRTDYTADRGRYLIPIPYGWSGTLTAVWLWNDDEAAVGRFTDNPVRFDDLIESANTDFEWHPTAVVSGQVYRAAFDTNTIPVTLTHTLYSNCLDRAEIPSGLYVGRTAAISNAAYTISVPHQWYHSGEDRILFINPTNSLSGDSHGVYDPLYFVFRTPPLIHASVDFTWVPCDLAISGMVTNNLGGPVTNQAVLFVSNCIDLTPVTNTVSGAMTNVLTFITEIVTTNDTTFAVTTNTVTTTLTNAVPVVIFSDPVGGTATMNAAGSVWFYNDTAFLLNTSRHAFAESPWVTTATNGVYTNWVSLGWSGAILPVSTNRTFIPQAVFIDNLTSNLTGVVFGSD